MRAFFGAIEQSAISVWMREDAYAYFLALIGHAFGMAVLVGGGIVVCLLCLRARGALDIGRPNALFPAMWLGAFIAAVSGVLLLVGYPAKALTNPLFAVKFACLLIAALGTRRLAHLHAGAPKQRILAVVSLLLWLGAVAAGKLLLHTYTILTVT